MKLTKNTALRNGATIGQLASYLAMATENNQSSMFAHGFKAIDKLGKGEKGEAEMHGWSAIKSVIAFDSTARKHLRDATGLDSLSNLATESPENKELRHLIIKLAVDSFLTL